MPVDVVTVQGNFAYAAHSAGGALCIDHGYPVAWIRSADTARLGHPLAVAVAHNMAGFGVAEYFVGRDAQGLLGPFEGGLDGRGQRLNPVTNWPLVFPFFA